MLTVFFEISKLYKSPKVKANTFIKNIYNKMKTNYFFFLKCNDFTDTKKLIHRYSANILALPTSRMNYAHTKNMPG